jgi:hypothetical protein
MKYDLHIHLKYSDDEILESREIVKIAMEDFVVRIIEIVWISSGTYSNTEVSEGKLWPQSGKRQTLGLAMPKIILQISAK